MTIFHRNIKGAQVQQNTMNSAETGMDPTANSITELLQEELWVYPHGPTLSYTETHPSLLYIALD